MGNTCDVLILVLSRVSTQDLPVVKRIIRWWTANSFGNLAIVHNLQTVTTAENLKRYIDQMRPIFNDAPRDKNCPWVLKQATPFPRNNSRAVIHHCFIGNVRYLSEEAKPVFSHLRDVIKGAPVRIIPFRDMLEGSIRTVVSKYYILPENVKSLTVEIKDTTIICPDFAQLKKSIFVVGSKLEAKGVSLSKISLKKSFCMKWGYTIMTPMNLIISCFFSISFSIFTNSPFNKSPITVKIQ